LDLERRLGKEEILELYLNVISFSDGCVGVGEAAEHYFSKKPMELTTEECATIAAITNYPSYYNPINRPENNLARRNLILSEMGKQGFLSQNDANAAIQMPLSLHVSQKRDEEVRSWYLDMVIEDVIHDLCQEYGMSRAEASRRVLSGGLRIDIAMDEEIQRTVEEYYRSVVQTPEGENGERAQSALIVLDGKTGDVLGVAGGVGEKTANRIQNFATQTLRPPGSSLKPITVYAPALEKGIINWATVYDDVPVNFGRDDAHPWPKNANGVYRGLTNVSYAVSHSTNTVAVKILEQVGLRQSFEMAKEKFPNINFTWYIYDEPCYDVMNVLPKVIKVYSEALPGLNLFMVDTPYSDSLPPYHTRVASFSSATINPQVVNFKESWFYQYTATIEDGNYLRNRFYPWQVYMANGCGVLLWNVIYYGSAKKGCHNPWTNLTAMYDHAQPTIFYPPREGKNEGTVMSMRTINISDAIDDFDYIKLYEAKKGADATKKLLSKVLPTPLAHPDDPLAFLELRRQMAEVLDK
jgi:hypothetical protein